MPYARLKLPIFRFFWGRLGDNKLFLKLVNVFAFSRHLLVELIQGFILSFQWVLTFALIILATVYFIKFRKNTVQTERSNVTFHKLPFYWRPLPF